VRQSARDAAAEERALRAEEDSASANGMRTPSEIAALREDQRRALKRAQELLAQQKQTKAQR
jgi:hypothetical protein